MKIKLQRNRGIASKKCENKTLRSMKNELPEVLKSNFQKYENQTSGSMKNELPEVLKSNSNDTDKIQTEIKPEDSCTSIISYLSFPEEKNALEEDDMMSMMDRYRAQIRYNIDYENLKNDYGWDHDCIDELVELMVEIMLMPDTHKIRIGGVEKPVSMIKNRFMKLTQSHITYVLLCLKRNRSKVGNIRAYLLTALYNSPMTMNHYYQAEVNHDLYGEPVPET